METERGWLYKAFLPLARERATRFLWSGYLLPELNSVACVGLGLAVRGFDPETHKNGLAAYAIPWIDGELKDFITKGQSVVMGERNERGKFLPKASHVNHFGNVAIGDGTVQPDVAFDGPTTGAEPDNSDDEDCSGGSLLATFADHRLEAIRGADFRERLKSYRGGIDLQIRWRAGRWKWIGDARLDRDARLFLAERREFYKRGLGYFLRSRRIEKYPRQLLPYKPPAWTQPATKLGPANYYYEYRERLRSYERLEHAAYVSTEERNASQPNWKRPTPKRAWALEQRVKLKAEHARMFWSSDNLSNYEIFSEPCYSRVLHESYTRPYRVAWLLAEHDFYEPKKGTINVRGEPSKPTGRLPYSPYLIGESDYGDKDIGFCLEGWAQLGDWHKLPPQTVGKEIALYKPRKIPLHLKPASKLVLLFWARQIVAWHYLKHWHPLEKGTEEYETVT